MAWYTTGTVQVANGSATVTGSGTAWAGPAVKVGYAFMGPDGNLYEISAVNTSAEITLAKPYAGSNGSGQTYGIIPTQSLNVELHAAMLEVVSLAREKLEVLESATTDGAKVTFDNDLTVTGQISGANGTVSLPSFSFDSDSNTGLYRPAADTLGFATGGAERMRIDVSGRIGFGTTAPSAAVDVRSDVNGPAVFKLYNQNAGASAYAGLALAADGNNFFINNFSDASSRLNETEFLSTAGGSAFIFSPSNSEKMRIDSAGNVGIGTSAATEKLAIQGNSPFILINNLDESLSGIRFADAQNAGERFQVAYNASDASFNFALMQSNGSLLDRMIIDGTGNVGIGPLDPVGAKLVVHKSDNGSSTEPTIRLTNSGNGASGFQNLGALAWGQGTINWWDISATRGASLGGGHLAFNTYANGSTQTERMRLDSAGNLLIGTTAISTSAGAQLFGSGAIYSHMAGTGYAEQMRFYRNSATVGSISTTGSSTSYNTSSDYRLKEDWRDIDAASAKLMALKPVNFAWKADGSRTDGFLAHELAEVIPNAVTGEKDGEEMQSVDHSKIVPLLTAALQEAFTKIDALEARLAILEGE